MTLHNAGRLDLHPVLAPVDFERFTEATRQLGLY